LRSLNKCKSTCLIILIIIINLYLNTNISYGDVIQWDDQWSYSKEISIPFDTSLETAKFQPIDISIEFENECWAKNEFEHSIRVICQNNDQYHEIESQIYNLQYSSEDHISSCNLVFLIHEEATGKENYIVYYDDAEKPSPDYVDHVSIGESYYRYEPIPGYPLESYYYKIVDDDFVIYSVSQDGQFMGYNTGQHIYKMIENSMEVIPKNGELFAAFDFKYCYDDGVFDYSSTSQKLNSKEILTDGNLMLEFILTSTSKLGDLKTTATYKYYHCPGENSRIHVHAKHESLSEITIFSDAKTDGTYASLQMGGVKSKSIEDLNIGRILPYMHFVNERNNIEQYLLDIDPEYISDTFETRIFGIKDDVDLGDSCWVSFDEGDAGTAHALIFSQSTFIFEGIDEHNGVQLSAFEMDYPHLPGLENNIATLQLCRNSYESGSIQDIIIPSDFVVEFDAEFFSSKNDGFSIIEKEAEIFQKLSLIKPKTDEWFEEDSEEIEKHSLDVSVHFSHSTPMGSSLSALLGKNLSYITVEIYKADEFRYSSNAVRLPMNPLEDIEKLTFVEKIKEFITIFDWRNVSLVKTARFHDLELGEYVVRVFMENPVIGKEREYIGFTVFNLQEDSKIHVYCHNEKQLNVTITDQKNNCVESAEVFLKVGNSVIARGVTNDNGQVVIKAPWQANPYDFFVEYNDILVYKDAIRFNLLPNILSSKKSICIDRYSLTVRMLDTWQLSPGVDIFPVLINKNVNNSDFSAISFSLNSYYFSNITPGSYQIHVKYKSFMIDKIIHIEKDEEISLDFPAEFILKMKFLDLRGFDYYAEKIVLARGTKHLEIQNPGSGLSVTLPPGVYIVTIYKDGAVLASRAINIIGDLSNDIITNQEPLFPIFFVIFSFGFIILFLVYSYLIKDAKYFLYILPVSFIIISFVMPWWSIVGENQQYETVTNMFIYPSKIVTMISSSEVISGEIAYLPDLFVEVIGFIPLVSLIGCLLLVLSFYLKKYDKKNVCLLTLLLAIVTFSISVIIFVVAMNSYCEIGLGSFAGTGYLDVSIPGEETYISVLSSWGPGIGFYSYIISVICVFMLIADVFQNRWCYGKT
jgi:hypothetical protein